MDAQIIQLDPIHVVMYRHTGPYEELGPVFDDLFEWVNRYAIPIQRTIGIYWDNPDFTAASRLRSAACVEVPQGYRINNSGGLGLSVEDISGGTYVTTRYVGPYEGLTPVWTELTSYIENTLRRRISMHPAFEIYVNDASETPPEDLVTELYMPVL